MLDFEAIKTHPGIEPDTLITRSVHATADTGLHCGLLQAVLNQVDYGLAVVNVETQQIIFANVHAQSALHPANPQSTGLCVTQGRLCTREADQADQLATALGRTRSRVRGLLRLTNNSGHELAVAVMPLSEFNLPDSALHADSETHASAHLPSYALLVFAKQQLCDTTTVTLFARERGLTGAEGQVLAHVCKGLRPSQIATHQGVQVSTVRTQLRSIRLKTASDSVRELVEKVSILPPLARYLPSFMGGTDAAGISGGRQIGLPA